MGKPTLTQFRPDRVTRREQTERDLGDDARNRRDWATAATHYSKYLSSQPLDFAIWVQLGHMLKELGHYDEAEFAYQKANDLNPVDPDLWLNRGHLAKLRRNFHAATECYSQSFDLNQNDDARKELIALGAITFVNHNHTGPHSTLDPLLNPTTRAGNVELVDSTQVSGWVMGSAFAPEPVDIVVVRDGEVVARGRTAATTPESMDFQWPTGAKPFVIQLDDRVRLGDALFVYQAGEQQPLTNVPLVVEPSHRARAWLNRHEHLSKAQIERKRSDFARETIGSKLSILMPLSSEEPEHLRQVISSVTGQWCPHWEMICVYDGSNRKIVTNLTRFRDCEDGRISFVEASCMEDVVMPFKKGLERVSGDYTAIFQREAFLEPEAVFRILDAAKSGSEILFSDQLNCLGDYTDIRHFVARPAFSLDHFLSTKDLGIFVALKSEHLARIELPEECSFSQVVTEATRQAISNSRYVAHVPGFLVRAKTHSSVNVKPALARPSNFGRAQQREESSGNGLMSHDVLTSAKGGKASAPLGNGVLVVIPTRDGGSLLKACVSSIIATKNSDDVKIVIVDNESQETETLDYLESLREFAVITRYPGKFNYAKMHNDVVRAHSDGEDLVLFINDDVEAIEAGWMERMRSLACRPDVGVVGATLLYADRRIQHAGVVLGVGGLASHAHRYLDFEISGKRNHGPTGSLVSTREYVAVTGACMMMKRDAFLGVGGFDEEFVIDYNDIDLCLRIGSLGYRVLNSADVVLYHHESATRGKGPRTSNHTEAGLFARRWRNRLSAGDPFYNPLLSMIHDHSLGQHLEMYHPIRITDLNPVLRPYEHGMPRHVAAPSFYP